MQCRRHSLYADALRQCVGSLKSEDKYVPFDLPADGSVKKIVVAAWGNAISWEITDQELSWVRQEEWTNQASPG